MEIKKQNVMPLRDAIAANGSKIDFILDELDKDGHPHTFAVFGNDNLAAIGKKAKEALIEMKMGTKNHSMDEFKYQEVWNEEDSKWVPCITLKGGLQSSVSFSLLSQAV